MEKAILTPPFVRTAVLDLDFHDDPLQRNLQEQSRTTLRQERKMWHRIILHLNSSIIQSILWLLAPRFQYYFYRSFILLYPLRQWHFYSYLANYLSEIRKDELNWNNFQITIMPIIHSLITPPWRLSRRIRHPRYCLLSYCTVSTCLTMIHVHKEKMCLCLYLCFAFLLGAVQVDRMNT